MMRSEAIRFLNRLLGAFGRPLYPPPSPMNQLYCLKCGKPRTPEDPPCKRYDSCGYMLVTYREAIK